jgi:hypothetical protein
MISILSFFYMHAPSDTQWQADSRQVSREAVEQGENIRVEIG